MSNTPGWPQDASGDDVERELPRWNGAASESGRPSYAEPDDSPSLSHVRDARNRPPMAASSPSTFGRPLTPPARGALTGQLTTPVGADQPDTTDPELFEPVSETEAKADPETGPEARDLDEASTVVSAAPVTVTPDVRLSRAIRRHPWSVATPVLVLAAAAVAVGVARAPQHNAEARLLVGTLDIKAQAVPGYVLATQQLAESYSRLGATQAVLVPAAQQLHTTPSRLRSDVTITALPENPIIRVLSHSTSARTAAAEANAVADSLDTYVASLANTYTSDAATVTNYQNAAADFEKWSVRRDGLKDTLAQLRTPGSILAKSMSSAERRSAIAVTTARLVSVAQKADMAELVVNGNAAAYNARLQDQRQPQTLSSLGQAANAGTDRAAFIEQALVAAVVLGGIIGAAYAVRRERHEQRAAG